MTVPTNISRVEYDGNGLATEFAYTFKIFDKSDLRISLLEGENEQILSVDTDYTVTGVGGESGGNVVFTTAPPAGKIVLIIREIEITQTTDLRNQGSYYPETVEDEFDRSRMIDQQLADDIRRSIRVPPGDDAGFDAELPRGIVGQANRAVITNGSGTGFEAGPTADQVASAQQYSLEAKGHKEGAQLAEQGAADASILSMRWANEGEDIEVSGGEYSSKHYAAKSFQEADRSSQEADRSRDEADRAQGVVDNTQSYITIADDFHKADGSQPAWTAPTATTLETASDLALVVGGKVVQVAAGTAISLPSLSSGTDYFIYAFADGSLEAVPADDAAPTESRLVGGFHAFDAGDGIAERSLWDLNWRPKCNPRAMVLSPDNRVWADIYLMDVEYGLHGYSRLGQQIADDGDRPIMPEMYGGDGVATYGSMSWWVAVDLAASAGKRLPLYDESTVFAYGVVERQAVGTDPGTTQHQAGHRSACGVEQATGVMWQWGADVAATAGSQWRNIAEGRGDVYASNIVAPLFGAYWNAGSNAGSRASLWASDPSNSSSVDGARAVSDHLNLQTER